MDIKQINQQLSTGVAEPQKLFAHLRRLEKLPIIFENTFDKLILPTEPGILLIRGPRQYGKSTWLEQKLLQTIAEFGPGSAFYLNGDFLADTAALSEKIENCAVSFSQKAYVKRIFIDEITSVNNWEIVLKRLVDNGTLDDILIITTGSKATDLRQGAERLPGRKGKLEKTNYLFTPISYRAFYDKCHRKLKKNTLSAYLISGGSPIACSTLASEGSIPEYVIQLVRDWVEGEVAKSGRHRSALINVLNTLFRFGGTPVGQAKLAREAGLANNTVAYGYIELLNDLGCVIPSYPMDMDKQVLQLRKPCKYHYMNLLVATTYHPSQLRSAEDFNLLPETEQSKWYEWLVAQELQRRIALTSNEVYPPLAFWQNKSHEIDFIDQHLNFIEVKREKANPLEFAWFPRQFPQYHLTIINNNKFSTPYLDGKPLEEFLLSDIM